MCYLLAIGVSGAPWQLAAALELETSSELELGEAPLPLLAAFPPSDRVRVITLRRCSCDLLVTRPPATQRHARRVGLIASLRRALLSGTREMGGFRCYVSSGAQVSPSAQPRLRVPRAALTSAADALPVDRLIEVG